MKNLDEKLLSFAVKFSETKFIGFWYIPWLKFNWVQSSSILTWSNKKHDDDFCFLALEILWLKVVDEY